MSRVLRSLVRLSVGLFTALLMGAGSVAYASQPVPDVPSDNVPQLPEYGPTSQVQDPVSMVQQIGWMLAGAALIVLISAGIVGLTVLARRHRDHTGQLHMP